jgi:hypothetical protein
VLPHNAGAFFPFNDLKALLRVKNIQQYAAGTHHKRGGDPMHKTRGVGEWCWHQHNIRAVQIKRCAVGPFAGDDIIVRQHYPFRWPSVPEVNSSAARSSLFVAMA